MMSQAAEAVGEVAALTPGQKVLQAIAERFSPGPEPDWVTFFREVLGVDGLVHRIFPAPKDREAFYQSAEYGRIQELLANLRARSNVEADDGEPTRVITVRLPRSMHEALRCESFARQTSLNKLCISKLLQSIHQDRVPPGAAARPRRRGSIERLCDHLDAT